VHKGLHKNINPRYSLTTLTTRYYKSFISQNMTLNKNKCITTMIWYITTCKYTTLTMIPSNTYLINTLSSYKLPYAKPAHRIPPFKCPRGLTFCKKSAKRLFILFCQFLLGKKLILGPEGGEAFIRVGALNWGYTVSKIIINYCHDIIKSLFGSLLNSHNIFLKSLYT